MMSKLVAVGIAAAVGFAGAAEAGELAELAALELAGPREFRLDWFGAEEPPAPAEEGAEQKTEGEVGEPEAVEKMPGFGSAGSDWLTVGGAAAWNFAEDYDFNAHFAWSTFIADRLEVGVEGAGWYFAQEGQNTGGVSGMFVFRYHFWSGPKGDFEWSSFLDFGTGMLVGFDEVPDGGSGFNFIQRVGVGMTKDLDASDGPAHGARLTFGIRWHHISNGRFEGDGRNPARDSILGFVGVQWDF
jgi:hypothetical protein